MNAENGHIPQEKGSLFDAVVDRLSYMSVMVSVLFWAVSVFSSFPSLAASLDQNILMADPAYYQKLMASLDAAGLQKEDVLLQKTLLKKLIYFATKKPEDRIDISPPRDTDQYLDFFERYITWSRRRAAMTEKIDETTKNIKVLKDQISSLSQKDPSLLTLQLQYAFYKKGLEFYRASLNTVVRAMDEAPKVLVEALPGIKIDERSIPSNLQKIDSAMEKLDAGIQARRIEVERLNLLEKEDDAKRLKAAIKGLLDQKQKLVLDKMKILFLKFSAELREKRKEVFKTGSQIVSLASALEDGKELGNDLAMLLDGMDTLVLGKARTLHGQTLQEIKLLLVRVYKAVSAPIFSIGGTPVSILKLAMALAVFILGFFMGSFYKRNINRISLAGRTITPSTRTLLANLGYYAIVTAAFLIGLGVVGIDMSSFALVAGALSVGIGFGLQNIVSNLVSGIILMFERSVKIGDFIEFEGKLRGRVTDLRMRSMTITTNANIDVIVPNQYLIENRVINWTMRDQIRRFDIPFGVAYGTSPDRVMEVVTDAVNKSGFKGIVNTPARKTSVIMVSMGESSVDFYLRVWIKGIDVMHERRTRSRFLVLVYNALYESGIEIPFPQRDLHLRSVEEEIPLLLKGTERDGPESSGDSSA